MSKELTKEDRARLARLREQKNITQREYDLALENYEFSLTLLVPDANSAYSDSFGSTTDSYSSSYTDSSSSSGGGGD